MSVGKRIKDRRLELKMSVDELARCLNKNRTTIYRYEKGDIENLPIDILEPLAKALDTTPAYLMGWGDDTVETGPSSFDDITMGDVFKALRLGSNLTIQEFSSEIGLSAEDIRNYETGKSQIPVNIINLVADFFGISIAEIVNAHKTRGNTNSANFEMKKERFERFKKWNKEFGSVHFTDEEIGKVMEYTRFLLSQREK